MERFSYLQHLVVYSTMKCILEEYHIQRLGDHDHAVQTLEQRQVNFLTLYLYIID